MSIFLLILIIIIFYNSKCYLFSKENNDNYLSKNTTTSIKGIFVVLVFLSHISQYFDFNGLVDKPYILFQKYLGQLIVCVFLFYSGYGIYESIKTKGRDYIKKSPKNRILKVLLQFDIAILLFLLLNIILINKISIYNLLFSFIGWESIGNSNWFIFAILYCYLITYFSFKLIDNKKVSIFLIFALTIVYILVIRQYREIWWYDTILCYPFGILFSFYIEKFKKIISINFKYYITCLILFILFVIFYKINGVLFYEMCACIFCLIVVLISVKINISNKILLWLGKNVFGIYILQRLPMIFFDRYCDMNKYLFVIITFVVTILITIIFNEIIIKVNGKVLKER